MEVGKMSLLGIALTTKSNNEGTVYVEYHRCDQCGHEYRVYLKSPKDVEEAFKDIAKRLGNGPDKEDLCFNCQNGVIADQPMMPLDV